MHKNLCSCCPQISNFSYFSYFGTKIAKSKLGCYSTLSTSSPSSPPPPYPPHDQKLWLTHLQVWWKAEYGKSSGDHGTLAFSRSSRLNRIAVTKELKKDVNACIDFISTVMKGYFLACACGILAWCYQP